MKPQDNTGWENVKLPTALVNRLRKHKETYFVPITTFVTNAVEKELATIPKKKTPSIKQSKK